MEDIKIGMLIYYLKHKGVPEHRIRVRKGDFLVIEMLDEGIIKRALARGVNVHKYYTIIEIIKPWGYDTVTILRKISKRCNLSLSKIKPLGLKDARAVARQYIIFKGIISEKHKGLDVVGYINKEDYTNILNFKNYFIISVYHNSDTTNLLNEIEKEEIIVPNFFGYQRFGEPRLINHIVGKYLIKRNFKEAVLTFLTSTSSNENLNYLKWRRELLNTLNFREALKDYPKGLHYENNMLKHLINRGEDYLGAFRCLPISIRRLFTMAYQSYIFNLILSERINLGLPINRPTDGDYILGKRGISEYREQEGENKLLLPLIGYAYKPSAGLQGELEKRILKELSINPKEFYVREMPEVSLKGGFRTAIQDIYFTSILTSEKTIKFNMVLEKGCYATVFLREILKPKMPIKQGY